MLAFAHGICEALTHRMATDLDDFADTNVNLANERTRVSSSSLCK